MPACQAQRSFVLAHQVATEHHTHQWLLTRLPWHDNTLLQWRVFYHAASHQPDRVFLQDSSPDATHSPAPVVAVHNSQDSLHTGGHCFAHAMTQQSQLATIDGGSLHRCAVNCNGPAPCRQGIRSTFAAPAAMAEAGPINCSHAHEAYTLPADLGAAVQLACTAAHRCVVQTCSDQCGARADLWHNMLHWPALLRKMPMRPMYTTVCTCAPTALLSPHLMVCEARPLYK